MESSYQKFAKDIVVVAAANFLTILAGLVLLPVITKTLGAHDYGIWAQVMVTINLLMALAGLGLPYAMSRFLAAKKNREEIQEEFYSVFSLVFLTSVIASCFVIVFADFIAGALFDGATQIVRMTGGIALFQSLSWVYLSRLRAFRQMNRYSLFQIGVTCVQLGAIVYLVLNGHGLFRVVLAFLVVRAILFLILFCSTSAQLGIRRPHFSRMQEYLSFGLPTIPAAISMWVIASSDRYVIAYFLGATSVGIYSAGYTLGSTLLMATSTVLVLVLLPTLSKLYDEGRMTEVRKHLSYSLKYSMALAIPFVFGAAVLGKQVLRIFSTAEISSQGHSIVPLVALALLLYGACVVVSHILSLVKKTRTSGAILVLAALVNLLLNILIVPTVGILGAAITTAVAYSVALGLMTYYSFRELRFGIEWSFILKSLTASVIMSLLVWRLDPIRTQDVVIAVAGGVILYAVCLLLMKGFKREEIRFFRGLFRAGQ